MLVKEVKYRSFAGQQDRRQLFATYYCQGSLEESGH